jgi:hypothetical protein
MNMMRTGQADGIAQGELVSQVRFVNEIFAGVA